MAQPLSINIFKRHDLHKRIINRINHHFSSFDFDSTRTEIKRIEILPYYGWQIKNTKDNRTIKCLILNNLGNSDDIYVHIINEDNDQSINNKTSFIIGLITYSHYFPRFKIKSIQNIETSKRYLPLLLDIAHLFGIGKMKKGKLNFIYYQMDKPEDLVIANRLDLLQWNSTYETCRYQF